MESTLLERFIDERKTLYAEPSRKGLPKGEPIGFSRKKYLASLYMLTADKQITVAMELGISYGLVRKWNTERAFTSLIRKHCREFANTFVRHLSERYARQGTAPGEAQDRGKPGLPGSRSFSDAGNYGPSLMAEVLKAVVNAAQKAEEEGAFVRGFTILSSFLEQIVPLMEPGRLEEIGRKAGIDIVVLERGVKLGVIERVKRFVMKKEPEDAERAEVCQLLDQLIRAM
jgi:hypothetical protein